MRKGSSHQQHCLRKGIHPGRHILFPHIFQWKPLNSCAIIHMPFSPVSKTSKLNIADQSILSPMFSHRFHSFSVICNKLFLVIIRGKSLSKFHIIPGSCLICFFIQPFRNIHMLLCSRHIADKSQYNVFSFFSPAVKLILFLNFFPVVLSLFRLQFCPGNIHI